MTLTQAAGERTTPADLEKPSQIFILQAPRLSLGGTALSQAVSDILEQYKEGKSPLLRRSELPPPMRAEAAAAAAAGSPTFIESPSLKSPGEGESIFATPKLMEFPDVINIKSAPEKIAYFVDNRVASAAAATQDIVPAEIITLSQDLGVKLATIGTTADISVAKGQSAIVILPVDNPVAKAAADSHQGVVIEGNVSYSFAKATTDGYAVLAAKPLAVGIQDSKSIAPYILSGKVVSTDSKDLAAVASRALLRSKSVLLDLNTLRLGTTNRPDPVLQGTVSFLKTPYDYRMKAIGKGQFGTVVKVDFTKQGDAAPSISIAIKSQAMDSSKLFLNELVHNEGFGYYPNFAKFYAATVVKGVEVSRGYLATEALAGSWSDARQKLSQAQITDLMIGGSDAVAAIEAAGRVHHDIKAENFLYDEHGVTRLIDLAGVDKQVESLNVDALLSHPGTYWPYETTKLLSSNKVMEAYNSARMDRFALGLALVEMRLKKDFDVYKLLEESDSIVPFKFDGPPIVDGDKFGSFLTEHRARLFEEIDDDELTTFLKMIGNDHASRPSGSDVARLLRKKHQRTLLQVSQAPLP